MAGPVVSDDVVSDDELGSLIDVVMAEGYRLPVDPVDRASTPPGSSPVVPSGGMERTKPVVEIPDGQPGKALGIEDLEFGDGDSAATGHQVEVHYVGVAWSSREQFDASWDRNDTFSFKLGAGQVIPGWEQGVMGMKVGGRRKLTIPPVLGYGAAGAGGVIAPNETLVFVVDLLGVS